MIAPAVSHPSATSSPSKDLPCVGGQHQTASDSTLSVHFAVVTAIAVPASTSITAHQLQYREAKQLRSVRSNQFTHVSFSSALILKQLLCLSDTIAVFLNQMVLK